MFAAWEQMGVLSPTLGAALTSVLVAREAYLLRCCGVQWAVLALVCVDGGLLMGGDEAGGVVVG